MEYVVERHGRPLTLPPLSARSSPTDLVNELRGNAASNVCGLVNVLAAALCAGIIVAPFIALLALSASL
jgi:hypothetical protein